MVSFVAPWLEDSGARIRVANELRALAKVGEVDLYAVLDTGRIKHGPPPPPDLPVRRLRMKSRPSPPLMRQRLEWMRPGGPPRRVAGWHGDLGADLRSWAEDSYDLIWLVRAPVVAAVGALPAGPVILDLDDLNDVVALEAAAFSPRRLTRWSSRVESRRWAAHQRRIASRVAVMGVCSELDRTRLGLANAVVIPNGYEVDPLPDTVSRPVHDPPTLLLQGSLLRPPLADAAARLAREILPLVRARVEARLLLVGPADPSVMALGELDAVETTGFVPDMAPWLGSADVVAVPMRWGSGTRIKILEAFAHGIPVVSSTLGAEGLDVTDGTHLLIRDDPASFAEACRRLLTDPDLRAGIAGEARALYDARYRWEPIRAQIADLARTVAASDRAGSRG
jgi:glycosyltransferase involved in cell wall biosynthesis